MERNDALNRKYEEGHFKESVSFRYKRFHDRKSFPVMTRYDDVVGTISSRRFKFNTRRIALFVLRQEEKQ